MDEYELSKSEAIAYRLGFDHGKAAAMRVAWRFARGIIPRVKGHIMPYPDEIAEKIGEIEASGPEVVD